MGMAKDDAPTRKLELGILKGRQNEEKERLLKKFRPSRAHLYLEPQALKEKLFNIGKISKIQRGLAAPNAVVQIGGIFDPRKKKKVLRERLILGGEGGGRRAETSNNGSEGTSTTGQTGHNSTKKGRES